MIALDREISARGLKSRMTLQVHDELLFDVVPEEREEMEELVKREMENVAEFSIPIVADVGVGGELAGYQVEYWLSEKEKANADSLSGMTSKKQEQATTKYRDSSLRSE